MKHISPVPFPQFAERRKQFAGRMKPGSVAILYSNAYMPRTGDQNFPFRQNSALFALAGLEQEGIILVLCPEAENPAYREIAFIPSQDQKDRIWHGDRYTTKAARRISGIDTIRFLHEWDKLMPALIHRSKTIYINRPIEDDDSTEEVRMAYKHTAYELQQAHPKHTLVSAQSILRKIMMVKHDGELAMMQHAIDVTGLAFSRILHAMRPGMKEYEAEAELTYVITQHGCRHAFAPIVASGLSACTLHYTRNDGVIGKNDLVLIDFGAEHACLNADMTRTIPASGRFSKRQKEIYSAVLRILNEITAIMRPGVTLRELNAETGQLVERELLHLRLITHRELRRQDPAHPLRQKYFMHGVSHHLGYDVHDTYVPSAKLRPGMVLTCEPGLYIAEEKTGIRLENDILITRGKPRNLMAHIPVDPEEIEGLMNIVI